MDTSTNRVFNFNITPSENILINNIIRIQYILFPFVNLPFIRIFYNLYIINTICGYLYAYYSFVSIFQKGTTYIRNLNTILIIVLLSTRIAQQTLILFFYKTQKQVFNSFLCTCM